MSLAGAHLRIARPTNDIDRLIPFYRDGLGFKVLGSFTDHEGFDGIMLGHDSAPYHLELTKKHGHVVSEAPSQDNLLVFYLPDEEVFVVAMKRMEGAGFPPVVSFNPYWDQRGKTFEDADGDRVVLVNMASPV